MKVETIGDATLYTGDVRECLHEMPAESVHSVVTSPPYWGLRDYGIEPSVWGGEPGCVHEWGDAVGSTRRTQRSDEIEVVGSSDGIVGRGPRPPSPTGAFCRRCGAWRGSLGLEPTPELYVQHLVEIFRELRPKLRKDGTVWVNVGDSYAGSWGNYHPNSPPGKHGQRLKQTARWNRPAYQSQDFLPPTATAPGLKPKDLCMIPARLALALRADGWWLRSDIIWSKPNPMPESCTDRPTKSHEYLFLLSKSGTAQYWTHRDNNGTRKRPKPDYRWLDKLLDVELTEEPLNWRTEMMLNTIGETVTEENGEEREPKKVRRYKRINLWRGHDYYYDAEAIKETSIYPDDDRKARAVKMPDGWDTGAGAHGSFHREGREKGQKRYPTESIAGIREGSATYATRNKRSVWTIATQSYKEAHFATFPEKLVEPCVLAGCPAQACPECGAPWARVVGRVDTGRRQKMADGWDTGPGGHGTIHREGREKGETDVPITEQRTLGFRPTCSCGREDTVPGTMADPFCGAGTALLVALRLGRRAKGIEIKPEYVDMTRKRIREEAAQGKLSLC